MERNQNVRNQPQGENHGVIASRSTRSTINSCRFLAIFGLLLGIALLLRGLYCGLGWWWLLFAVVTIIAAGFLWRGTLYLQDVVQVTDSVPDAFENFARYLEYRQSTVPILGIASFICFLIVLWCEDNMLPEMFGCLLFLLTILFVNFIMHNWYAEKEYRKDANDQGYDFDLFVRDYVVNSRNR